MRFGVSESFCAFVGLNITYFICLELLDWYDTSTVVQICCMGSKDRGVT